MLRSYSESSGLSARKASSLSSGIAIISGVENEEADDTAT